MTGRIHCCVGVSFLVVLLTPTAPAQETAEYFRQNCLSCHTIGGGQLTGPDLKDVTQRQDREWLVRFMLDPVDVIAGGDPYAEQLLEESRGVIMPALADLTADRAAALLDLIEAESQLEQSQFRGVEVSDEPFTPADVELGWRLFAGRTRLANGGPACLACHTVRGLEGLSGGKLGPDLSRVYERLGGRRNLEAWLLAPATPTMLPLFRQHPLEPDEVPPLVALFEERAQTGGEDTSPAVLNFFFLGLGGTVLLLVVFDAAWKKRFRSVRTALLRAAGEER